MGNNIGFFDRYYESDIKALLDENYSHKAIAMIIKEKYGLGNNADTMRRKISDRLQRIEPPYQIKSNQNYQPPFEGDIKGFNTTKSSQFASLKTELGLHENEFNLPTPEDDEIKIHQMPVANNKILILSDIHLPFHSISALTTALKYGKEHGANTIYINGDLIDFYAISRFEKEKHLRSLKNEIEMAREFLTIIRDLFPNASKYLKIGNHSARWNTYIRQNAKEFEGVDDFEFASVFRLDELGYKVIADKDLMKMGELFVVHGHEMYGGGGINPSRSLFLKTMRSTLMSHVHRTTEYSGKDINGKFITCWSIGCLSQLRPKYNPLSQYNHGFAFVETESNGDFRVRNLRIDNGKIY